MAQGDRQAVCADATPDDPHAAAAGGRFCDFHREARRRDSFNKANAKRVNKDVSGWVYEPPPRPEAASASVATPKQQDAYREVRDLNESVTDARDAYVNDPTIENADAMREAFEKFLKAAEPILYGPGTPTLDYEPPPEVPMPERASDKDPTPNQPMW